MNNLHNDDPYARRPWQSGFVHVCTWQDLAGVIRTHRADRAAARILAAGGLHDVAPAVGRAVGADRRAPPLMTSSVWTAASTSSTRPWTCCPGLVAYQVVDTASARTASDHLPVAATWSSTP